MGDDQIEQRRVIADGEILTALNTACNSEEFSAEHIAAGERLFVYAHSLVNGATQRSQHAGLKKLQQLLAHPTSEPAAVTVLGMVPPSAYGRFSYLFEDGSPLRYRELPPLFPLEGQDVAEPAAWHELAKKASEEELEIQCSTFRHSLQSVMAATRIYLGAAIAGHIDANQPDFEQTLSSLLELVERAGGTTPLELDEVVNGCINHQKRFSKDYVGIYKPKEIDLWVLDDHWVDHGWKLVFEALPFRSVKGLTRWEELEELISKEQSRPTTLMVDCNLGADEDTPTGLELLRSIRSRWQDVRIVFSTAYDDAALALTSLREGANVFFTKELNDTGDRRSLDYYRQFTSLLKPHPIESRVCSLWQTFSARDTQKNSTNSDPELQPPATLDIMLRLGFFLLFSLIDDDKYWRGNRLAVRKKHLYRAVVNLVGSGYPTLRSKEAAAKAGLQETARELINKAAHGGEIELDDLDLVLSGIFNLLCDKENNSSMEPWRRSQQPSFWPYKVADLKTDSSHPGVPIGTSVLEHDTSDGLGAIELMRGICGDDECESAHGALTVPDIVAAHSDKSAQRSYAGVILVDDAGIETGWFQAFQSIFPHSKTFPSLRGFLKYAEAMALAEELRIDLIVLDLKLPSFDAGYEALDEILKWDASVPVVTTSASWHSLEAIRSLRKGAIDFISKTLPHPRALEACVQFAYEYKSKCNVLVEYGESVCRKRWKHLHLFRQAKPKTISSEAQRKFKACSEHRNLKKSGSEWLVLPELGSWNDLVADQLALMLRLEQQMFFNRSQDLSLPLDNWRWEYVLNSKNEIDITKLVAIIAGNIVENLALWQWCLNNEQSVEIRRWGVSKKRKFPRGDEIDISVEIEKLGADEAWKWRNAVLHPENEQPDAWNARLCDRLVLQVFKAVSTCGKGTLYA